MLTIDTPALITADPFREYGRASAPRDEDLVCEPCADEGPAVLCGDHARLVIELL
jgi:hypothetical protein